jgi:hypothetical protein
LKLKGPRQVQKDILEQAASTTALGSSDTSGQYKLQVMQVARTGTLRSADTTGHCKHCRSSDTRVAGFSYTIGSTTTAGSSDTRVVGFSHTIGSTTTAGSGNTSGQERYCKIC